MPALTNGKHELFAQGLAKGKSQTEAYAKAGYAPSEQHASRLARNGKVQARVAELRERAAARVEVTVQSVAQQLLEDRALAHTAQQAGAAVSASMALAKLFGLVVEKTEAKVEVTDARERLARLVSGVASAATADDGAGLTH